MAGRRGWVAVGGLALLALARPGCGPAAGPPVIDATLAALLADTWPAVLEPALAEAGAAGEGLVAATAAWAAAEAAGEDAAGVQAAAQDAWRTAFAAWQRVEVMQLGPTASSLSAVGGQDLRDAVYSWPTVNPCAVDQQTVFGAWDEADFFSTHLVNVYGFAALETTLFSPAGVNVCPSQVDINASGDWEALGVDGVQRNRAAFAAALAVGVRDQITGIQLAWGGFAEGFADAGGEASPYDSPEQALNAVFDALFYLETEVKDEKLGGPLGLFDCGASSCLSSVETPLAGGSNVWIAENLVGFRRLFDGGDGTGLDDLLRENGHGDAADALFAALDAADSAAVAVTEPIDVAVAGDPTAALALHAALTAVGDVLESEVAPALVLQLPAEAAGDND